LGYPALFVDEKGKMRETWTDSLGRLIEVDEPDPAATTVRVYWWRGRRRGTSIATQSCAAAPDYTAESGLCREFWRQVQPGGSVRGTEQRDSERILGQHSVWACQCGTYNLRVGRSAQPGGGRADGFRASVWRAGSNGSGGHGAGGGGKGEVELRQPLFSGQNSSLRPE